MQGQDYVRPKCECGLTYDVYPIYSVPTTSHFNCPVCRKGRYLTEDERKIEYQIDYPRAKQEGLRR